MQLEPFEVELLRELHEGLRASLEQPDAADPMVARLFPRTTSDEDADEELRSLIFDDLLASRLSGLDALMELLDRGQVHRGRLRVDLVEEEAALLLGVLNDLRLALGARIGIERIERGSLTEDDPRVRPIAIIDHLAWWQEQVLAILDPPSVSHYEDRRDDGD